MSDKKHHWITSLVPALALAAGIIIASIGGIMTVSSSLKLALFESEGYNHVTKEDCRYDYNRVMQDDPTSTYERNDKETQDCLIERKHEELIRFQNSQKRNVVDGISALMVGGILMLIFRRRKK